MDKSYRRDLSWAKVYLDGILQSGVITADEEQGYVMRYEQNELGEYLIEGDDFIIEKYLGNVVITGKPGEWVKKGLYAK